MGIHAAIALGALDDALEVSPVRRVLDGGLHVFAAHLVEQRISSFIGISRPWHWVQ